MIGEYDDFCIQIPGTGNETNLPTKSFVLSRIPLFFKVHLHPPIREMSQKDEKKKKVTKILQNSSIPDPKSLTPNASISHIISLKP